jgi:small-conductance mechanosensitive channel
MALPKQTPEEKELADKQVRLSALTETLSQLELDLATIKADLLAFEGRYLRRVGIKYAELDEIEAEIAEIEARLHPVDRDAQEKASAARDQAHQSAHATQSIQEEEPSHFEPSDDIKKLYREAAKAMHPDLTTDAEARVARQAMMVEVNLAYEKGDIEKLRSIVNQWENSPDSVEGEGTGAELIRIIRKIALAEERLGAIDREITELKATELWRLKEQAEDAEKEGKDMLTEMVVSIESQIIEAKRRLDGLTKKRAE